MMHEDGAGALLGVDLPVLGQRAADALGLEEAEEFFLVGHVGAGGVAEAVAAAAVVLGEELVDLRGVVVPDAQLGAAALVPELRQRFGRLDAHAVDIEVLRIVVVVEQLLREAADLLAHGDAVEAEHVFFS